MSAKLAKLIKEARTNAGLTQQQLANMVPGLTVSDISKAEHNEKEPTQEELKGIAKATGVTQKSLLEAAGSTAKTSTAKTSTAKTSTAKTSTAKTSTAKTSTAKTSTSAATTSMKLTNAEKKLVELYRQADSETKKSVLKMLKGEESEINEILSSILGGAVGSLLKK